MIEILEGKMRTPQRVLIHGQEGVGKSTLSLEFPGALSIDIEGSTERMEARRTRRPKTWAALMAQISEITKAPPDWLQTLVIDTADAAERLACEAVCAENPGREGEPRESVEKLGWARGYTLVAYKFGEMLNALEEMRLKHKIHIVLIAHTAVRRAELPEEIGAFDRWEIKLETRPQKGQNVSALVKGWSDMILFLRYKIFSEAIIVDEKTKRPIKSKVQGQKRVICTEYSAVWDAKNRESFKPELPLQYDSIASAFPALRQSSATISVPEKQEKSRPYFDTLNTLLETSGITQETLIAALIEKGRFAEGMTYDCLPEEYIVKNLIPNWEKVCSYINEKEEKNENV